MAAKYDVRTSSDGQCYFNLKAANGKVILTSEGTVALSDRASSAGRPDPPTAHVATS
jgi:uncharacterized protein YegP (UPF0339 family)